MEILEAIFSRRSTRLFKPTPVPLDVLKQLIQAAASAPTASNAQNFFFGIIQDPQRIKMIRSLAPGLIGIPGAMMILCIRSDQNPKTGEMDIPEYTWMGIGSALQNITLAAQGLGIGSRPIGSFHKKAVKKYLGLPDNVQPVLILALGEPAEAPKAPKQVHLESFSFYEKWDQKL